MTKLLSTLFAVVLFATATYAGSEPPKKPMKNNNVQHIVLFKFKPETTEEKVKEIVAAFEALPSKISQIKGFQWGTNNSPETHAHGLTHAFILTFDSVKDRDAYLPHPAHGEFGKIVGPWIDQLTVVDFTNQAGQR